MHKNAFYAALFPNFNVLIIDSFKTIIFIYESFLIILAHNILSIFDFFWFYSFEIFQKISDHLIELLYYFLNFSVTKEPFILNFF